MKKEKKYTFIYEDKEGNELQKEIVEAKNKKDAIRISKIVIANTKINDLKKIIVKTI